MTAARRMEMPPEAVAPQAGEPDASGPDSTPAGPFQRQALGPRQSSANIVLSSAFVLGLVGAPLVKFMPEALSYVLGLGVAIAGAVLLRDLLDGARYRRTLRP